jgi:hypothetical protein
MDTANAKNPVRLPTFIVLLWLSGLGTAWAQSTANYEPGIARPDSAEVDEWDLSLAFITSGCQI